MISIQRFVAAARLKSVLWKYGLSKSWKHSLNALGNLFPHFQNKAYTIFLSSFSTLSTLCPVRPFEVISFFRFPILLGFWFAFMLLPLASFEVRLEGSHCVRAL